MRGFHAFGVNFTRRTDYWAIIKWCERGVLDRRDRRRLEKLRTLRGARTEDERRRVAKPVFGIVGLGLTRSPLQ